MNRVGHTLSVQMSTNVIWAYTIAIPTRYAQILMEVLVVNVKEVLMEMAKRTVLKLVMRNVLMVIVAKHPIINANVTLDGQVQIVEQIVVVTIILLAHKDQVFVISVRIGLLEDIARNVKQAVMVMLQHLLDAENAIAMNMETKT